MYQIAKIFKGPTPPRCVFKSYWLAHRRRYWCPRYTKIILIHRPGIHDNEIDPLKSFFCLFQASDWKAGLGDSLQAKQVSKSWSVHCKSATLYSPDYYYTPSGNVNCKIFTYVGIVIGLGLSQGKSFPSSTSHSHWVELQNLSAVLYSQTVLTLSHLNRVLQLTCIRSK